MPRSITLSPVRPADRQSVASRPGIRPADVPRRLLRQPVVTHSGDAGGFYCEHAFFTAQRLAPRAAVLSNRHGEPLVGFLHVPGAHDRWMCAPPPPPPADPGGRHARTRIVVGRALAGFCREALAGGAGGEEPVRLLLTGYSSWGIVVDNPTGDFVGRRESLDAALVHGFGRRLRLLPTVVGTAPWELQAAYEVQVAPDRWQGLIVCGWALPTSDEALDPGHPQSLPSAMTGSFQPHGVLSLGVARRRRRFYVEHTADDENLVDGRHQPAPARTTLPPNFALARAIHQGWPE